MLWNTIWMFVKWQMPDMLESEHCENPKQALIRNVNNKQVLILLWQETTATVKVFLSSGNVNTENKEKTHKHASAGRFNLQKCSCKYPRSLCHLLWQLDAVLSFLLRHTHTHASDMSHLGIAPSLLSTHSLGQTLHWTVYSKTQLQKSIIYF